LREKKRKKPKGFGKVTIIAGVIIIALAIFYFYTADQAKTRGFTFGNELKNIQDELKATQNTFESKVSMWKKGELDKEEFLEFSNEHIDKMEQISFNYDKLSVPESFVESVKLFKLSTDTQIESDKHLIKWIENDDESERIRSDSILQESFEYEMAALSLYNAAKKVSSP